VHEGGYFLVQTIPREIICSEDWGYLFAIRLTALESIQESQVNRLVLQSNKEIVLID